MRHSIAGRLVFCLLLGFHGSVQAGAAARELPTTRVSLQLSGAPSELLGVDLDGDGRRDLLLFVAWSHWTLPLSRGRLLRYDSPPAKRHPACHQPLRRAR
ncbi:MAG: hypothetical protein IPJ17_12905 [Holophagales bacterium]|nr:MAG: hypothetical protein IPJ17_12905 [Holophagales bacterium]